MFFWDWMYNVLASLGKLENCRSGAHRIPFFCMHDSCLIFCASGVLDRFVSQVRQDLVSWLR